MSYHTILFFQVYDNWQGNKEDRCVYYILLNLHVYIRVNDTQLNYGYIFTLIKLQVRVNIHVHT